MQIPTIQYTEAQEAQTVLDQLATYGLLLTEAQRYRRDNPHLDKLLGGIERGEWRDATEAVQIGQVAEVMRRQPLLP